ncbi:hypothetical protein C943_01366 [Mariniradius saccharolyticus AK6]|uniref:Uncharacterized protein n=1 Tax=Mariniradius saccharolyticus AK6 TaxID=1239962 RepID=M7XB29_9BACT|nr:hypothetical protein C943_01366 [Mariniradius saccharolyticus AK6]
MRMTFIGGKAWDLHFNIEDIGKTPRLLSSGGHFCAYFL